VRGKAREHFICIPPLTSLERCRPKINKRESARLTRDIKHLEKKERTRERGIHIMADSSQKPTTMIEEKGVGVGQIHKNNRE
jgi:hypothetical protein